MKNSCENSYVNLKAFFILVFAESSSTAVTTSALYKYDPAVTTTTSKFPVENCVSTTANAVTTATTAPCEMPVWFGAQLSLCRKVGMCDEA